MRPQIARTRGAAPTNRGGLAGRNGGPHTCPRQKREQSQGLVLVRDLRALSLWGTSRITCTSPGMYQSTTPRAIEARGSSSESARGHDQDQARLSKRTVAVGCGTRARTSRRPHRRTAPPLHPHHPLTAAGQTTSRGTNTHAHAATQRAKEGAPRSSGPVKEGQDRGEQERTADLLTSPNEPSPRTPLSIDLKTREAPAVQIPLSSPCLRRVSTHQIVIDRVSLAFAGGAVAGTGPVRSAAAALERGPVGTRMAEREMH